MRGMLALAALAAVTLATPAAGQAEPDGDAYFKICERVSGAATLAGPEAKAIMALGVQAWADHREGQTRRLMEELRVPADEYAGVRVACKMYEAGVVDTVKYITSLPVRSN